MIESRAVSIERLVQEVPQATSMLDLARRVGLKTTTYVGKVLRERLIEAGVDISHIPTGLGHNKGSKRSSIPDEEILTYGHRHSTTVKSRLLRLFPERFSVCNGCGIEPTWNGKLLQFHLEHIDGNRLNNNQENLAVLCPNCHSQTETYAGRNLRNKRLRNIQE